MIVDKEKNQEENMFLLQKVKSLEKHQEVLRQHIKDKDKLMSLVKNTMSSSTQTSDTWRTTELLTDENTKLIDNIERKISLNG